MHPAVLAALAGLSEGLELVGLHEAGRLGQPFPELPEEEEKPVSQGLVVAQRRVTRRAVPPLDGLACQRERGVAVPFLGRHESKRNDEGDQDGQHRTHRTEI